MKLSVCTLLAVCAFAQDADISGKWSGIFREGPIFVVLRQDGSKLSGSGGPSEKQQLLEFDKGKVEGDHVVFSAGPMHFDLRLAGDELRGEATGGGEPTKVTLKRIKSKPAGAPPPSFEVASVKRAPPITGPLTSSMNLDPGRITCTNVTLKKLIVNVYDVKEYQVSGPDWIDSELYNIVATMPRGTTGEEALQMMRALLADRFHLVMHHESKEVPVFALVVGKNGHKLKEVEFGRGSTSIRPGKLSAQNAPITSLTKFLSRQFDRPVLDMTGLKGFYNFELEWTPDQAASAASGPAESAVGPTVEVALQQQLGLKIEPRKAPVDVLVIDRAERMPTEN